MSEQPIPRGIEVLVKKASVDPEFRRLLLDKRAAAADAIGLKLSPAEETMLAAVTREQLETIIANTHVPSAHRSAFLGCAAVAMLAVLGTLAIVPLYRGETKGIRPGELSAEAIGGVGSIRSAMRRYAESHGGEYPVLTNATGADLEIIGISPADLNGKYSMARDYSVTSTVSSYKITARRGNNTYIVDQDGRELGTYTTGN